MIAVDSTVLVVYCWLFFFVCFFLIDLTYCFFLI